MSRSEQHPDTLKGSTFNRAAATSTDADCIATALTGTKRTLDTTEEDSLSSSLITWFLILYTKAKAVSLGMNLSIEEAIHGKESFAHYIDKGKFEPKSFIYKLARPYSKNVMTLFILTPNGFVRIKYNVATQGMVFMASSEVSENISGWEEMTLKDLITEVSEKDGAVFANRIISKAGYWPTFYGHNTPEHTLAELYQHHLHLFSENRMNKGCVLGPGEPGSGIADILYVSRDDGLVQISRRYDDDELSTAKIVTTFQEVPRY